MTKEKKDIKSNPYMRYSGMAFELVALLVIAVFVGRKLDAWMEFEKLYLTMTLLLLFFVGYFFRLYYALIK